jgi:hypothetical protein
LATFLTILFVSLLPIVAFAQKIVFAEKIDSLGNAFNCKNTHQIDLIKGSSIGLVFQSEQAITKPKIYAFIDKKEEGNLYKEFDTQRISIDKDGVKMAYCSYLFTEEGSYRIAFADAEKQEISHAFLTINFKSNLVFCEQIDENDLPINHKNKFKLNIKRNTEVYSFLKTSKPINCSDIFHNIYRYNGKDYSSLVSSDKFAVEADWKYTYAKATYSEIGKYKVEIRTNTNQVLGTNYLEIK